MHQKYGQGRNLGNVFVQYEYVGPYDPNRFSPLICSSSHLVPAPLPLIYVPSSPASLHLDLNRPTRRHIQLVFVLVLSVLPHY